MSQEMDGVPPMNRTARLLGTTLLLTLLLSQFNNCGNYSTPVTQLSGATSVTCSTPTCISPDPLNIKITPHLANGEYGVSAGLSEFNIGGDCNEVGFPYTKVRWELVLNGNVVRHSGMNVAGGAQPADSRCLNGRFLLYVNLAAIAEDNVDRTGLNTGTGSRSSYLLNVIIYGMTSPNDSLVQSAQNRAVVPLSAL